MIGLELPLISPCVFGDGSIYLSLRALLITRRVSPF